MTQGDASSRIGSQGTEAVHNRVVERLERSRAVPGLRDVAPGLGGGLVLILLGIYEQFVDALGNFFINRHKWNILTNTMFETKTKQVRFNVFHLCCWKKS